MNKYYEQMLPGDGSIWKKKFNKYGINNLALTIKVPPSCCENAVTLLGTLGAIKSFYNFNNLVHLHCHPATFRAVVVVVDLL